MKWRGVADAHVKVTKVITGMYSNITADTHGGGGSGRGGSMAGSRGGGSGSGSGSGSGAGSGTVQGIGVVSSHSSDSSNIIGASEGQALYKLYHEAYTAAVENGNRDSALKLKGKVGV
jgi:hypothetical protein